MPRPRRPRPRPHPLDELAERMAPVADQTIRMVRLRNRGGVAAAIGDLDVMELRALVVVLADSRRVTKIQRTVPDVDGVVDEIAVERVAYGDFVPLTPPEQEACAALLAHHGHGPSEISRRLGITGTRARSIYERVRRHRTPKGARSRA